MVHVATRVNINIVQPLRQWVPTVYLPVLLAAHDHAAGLAFASLRCSLPQVSSRSSYVLQCKGQLTDNWLDIFPLTAATWFAGGEAWCAEP